MIVAAATLLLGLLVSFPARIAYHWFAPAELRLSGIDGTVWRGNASEGQAAGVYIRNLHWNFKPLSLFAGKVAFTTRLDPANGFLSTDVFVSMGGTILFRNLDGAVPLGALQKLIQTPDLDGRIRLQFLELELSDGLPVSADGTVDISDLFVPGLAPTAIGDYRVRFSTTDDGIVASVEDTGGMFDLAGTLRISPDRLYSLTGLIAPTPTTPPGVIDQLRYLGSPNERGQREIRFEGEL